MGQGARVVVVVVATISFSANLHLKNSIREFFRDIKYLFLLLAILILLAPYFIDTFFHNVFPLSNNPVTSGITVIMRLVSCIYFFFSLKGR